MQNKRAARFEAEGVVVMVTAASEDEATHIGRAVVDAGLAACANILPRIRSIYRWQGKMADETEVLMLLKSRRPIFGALEKEIKRLHSYSVPEIIAVPIERGSEKYLRWLKVQTIKQLKNKRFQKSI
jgi:periplasmic divalent cation tolerance protein